MTLLERLLPKVVKKMGKKKDKFNFINMWEPRDVGDLEWFQEQRP